MSILSSKTGYEQFTNDKASCRFLVFEHFFLNDPGGLGINVNADTTIKSKQKNGFLSMCLLRNNVIDRTVYSS